MYYSGGGERVPNGQNRSKKAPSIAERALY